MFLMFVWFLEVWDCFLMFLIAFNVCVGAIFFKRCLI